MAAPPPLTSASAAYHGDEFAVALVDLWKDLRQPDIFWQVLTLALCIGIAWLVSRLIRRRKSTTAQGGEPERPEVWKLGLGGLKRILFPLIALLLVLVTRPLLEPHMHVHLLNLAVPLLLSMAIIRALFYVLRNVLPPGGVLVAFERSIATLVWGVVALQIAGLRPGVVEFLDGVTFPLGRQHISVWLVLQALFWVLLTLLVALWASSAIESRLMRAQSLHSSLRAVFARLARAVLMVVAVLVVLPLVGIDLTVLSVFGGALGVGLGFGLQKIASNYLSGFIILLDRSTRIGDVITIDQFSGEVLDITTRYVVLRGPDGREAIVPNEQLITSTVISNTHTDRNMRFATQVRVTGDADVERALAVLCEAAASQPRVMKDPAPAAVVSKFTDNGIELDLGFWVEDPPRAGTNVLANVNLEILKRFRAEGIQIPFVQREIQLVSTSTGAPAASPGGTPSSTVPPAPPGGRAPSAD